MNQLSQIDVAQFDAMASGDQIDLVCDLFEESWRRGETPNINEFLIRCDSTIRESLLVELLLVDRELRATYGQSVDRNEYLVRYPEYSTVINSLNFPTIADKTYQRQNISSYPAGCRFAHFELLERLGEGASGTVWKALDVRLRRHVALKLPRQQTMTEPERIRFRREGQTCAQLHHPNIVTVYEVGEECDQLFISSELIEGWTLRQWLDQHHRVGNDVIATLTLQLADALRHAHEQGIVHRDLKPANVLIDRAGIPFVTDFGLAKWNNQSVDMTVEGHLLGTPAYMSPEQARGNAFSADQRSDVYGLGALLYEMLTGRPPFAGDIASIIHQVIHQEPIAPKKVNVKIPRDLETICVTAMQKLPCDRYQSMQVLSDDLRCFLNAEPIRTRPASMLKQGWRLLNRRKAMTGMVLTSLGAAGSLGLAAMLAERNQELLGLRTVTIATEPPNARVAFIPLNSATGQPDIERRIMADGFSPVEVNLLPGDYLVITAMKDGRFHEVYRHVPQKDAAPGADYSFCRFQTLADGRVNLHHIVIPSNNIDDEMTLITGSEHYPFGFSGAQELPLHTMSVPSFWIDNHEFTWGEYKKRPQVQFDPNLLSDSPGDEFVMPMTFGSAMEIAEDLGKRLPTEVEYEYVATNQGTTKYPWGNDSPTTDLIESHQTSNHDSFSPVGNPAFDRTVQYQNVVGLCTNKAEWMIPQFLPDMMGMTSEKFSSLGSSRIFRGGDSMTIAGNPMLTPVNCDPRLRNIAPSVSIYPGLGFRCVRSAEPRIKYEEFE